MALLASVRKTLAGAAAGAQFAFLALIYVIIVVPYGALYRMLEPAIVRHFFSAKARGSYFIPAAKRYAPADFETTW